MIGSNGSVDPGRDVGRTDDIRHALMELASQKGKAPDFSKFDLAGARGTSARAAIRFTSWDNRCPL
jgi:hypothetical protein